MTTVGAAPVGGRQGSTVRVLLAEDNPVNRKVAAKLLEKRGYVVVAVEDGRQAVDAVEREAYDIVLMDVQMPVMDGLTATRTIRQGEERTGTHMPIVAVTAHAMTGDRERCIEAGMDDYVTKPIDATILLAAMERLLLSAIRR